MLSLAVNGLASPTSMGAVRASRAALVAAAVFVCSLSLQALLTPQAIGHYDEGIALYGAQRVLRGDVPYRDFWSLYGPAQSYVLGGLFAWFGESILVARIFDACCRAAIVVLVHGLTLRFASRTAAVVAAAFACCVLIGAGSHEAPLFPATALTLAAVRVAIHAADTGRIASWLLTGLAAGGAFAFRTDFGCYALATCGWGWLRRRARAKAWRLDRELAALIAGFAAITLPIALALVAIVPTADLYDDFVRIPSTIYVPMRRLPFPDLEPWRLARTFHNHRPLIVYLVYLPFVAVVAAAAASRLGRGRSDIGATGFDVVAFESVVLIEALFILKGSVRVELLHMAPALAVAGVLLATVLDRRAAAVRAIGWSSLIAAGVIAASPPHVIQQTKERAAAFARQVTSPARAPLCEPEPIERLRCFTVDADQRAAIGQVLSRTTASDTIYVGSDRHDRVLFNDAEIYFLAARKAATKWHDVHPGVQTSAAIQREMIDAFTMHPPAVVVLDDRWSAVDEPNDSAISSGITLLDDWLRAHYEVVFERGPYRVLAPRAAP